MPHIFPCLLLFFYWTYSCFIAPLRAKRTAQESQPIPTDILRQKLYAATIKHYFILAFIAVPAAALNEISIFGSFHMDLKLSLLAFGFLALYMLLIDPLEWKFTRPDIKQRLGGFIPRSRGDQIAWFAVSFVTAVSEEIVFRAVFFGIAYKLTGNYWAGAIASSILFAAAHWRYGFVGMPSTFAVGLGFQYFVKLSGGLYISIAIHFFHNAVNGMIYGAVWNRKSEKEVPEKAGISEEVVT